MTDHARPKMPRLSACLLATLLCIAPGTDAQVHSQNYARFATFADAFVEICLPQLLNNDTSVRASFEELTGERLKQMQRILGTLWTKNDVSAPNVYAFFVGEDAAGLLVSGPNNEACDIAAFEDYGLDWFEAFWTENFASPKYGFRGTQAVRRSSIGLRPVFREETKGWALRPAEDDFIELTGWYGEFLQGENLKGGVLTLSASKTQRGKRACEMFRQECE